MNLENLLELQLKGNDDLKINFKGLIDAISKNFLNLKQCFNKTIISD